MTTNLSEREIAAMVGKISAGTGGKLWAELTARERATLLAETVDGAGVVVVRTPVRQVIDLGNRTTARVDENGSIELSVGDAIFTLETAQVLQLADALAAVDPAP